MISSLVTHVRFIFDVYSQAVTWQEWKYQGEPDDLIGMREAVMVTLMIILGTFWGFGLVLGIALCRTAAGADRWGQQYAEEVRSRREAQVIRLPRRAA